METKKSIAREILIMQNVAIYSLIVSVLVSLICMFLFNPLKFDGEKYEKVRGIMETNYNDINTPIYSPYWWSDGFYKYCDREVSFNPYYPQTSYRDRKSYLIWKAFRFGLYSFLIILAGFILYRYSSKVQNWLTKNAK